MQVRVAAPDCEKCEVTRSQPLAENDIILELYDLLPENFDGWTGFKVITFQDVVGLFNLLGVHPQLWDDYYVRVMYFHHRLVESRQEIREQEKKERESTESWKRSVGGAGYRLTH